MTTQAPAGRRRLLPRMRLATLLVLVAVVGGAAGWYIQGIRAQRQAVQALRDAGAVVIYDWEWDPGIHSFRGNGKELSGWRRTLADRFGPDSVSSVASVSLGGVEGEGGSGATDEHIALIGHLKSLRELQMGRFTITEAGAAPIAGLKQLRSFEVADHTLGKPRPGPILARFGEDSRLERLFFIGAVITGDDIDAISRLSRLEDLRVRGGFRDLRDADMEKLSGLGRLKNLEFRYTRVTSGGLKSIGRMKSLESLSFEESAIDDLAPFLQLPGLRELHLGTCRVDDAGIAAAGRMPALEHFSAYSKSLTDAGLAHLRGAPALEGLAFESDSITLAGLESLAGIKTLKFIRLYGCKIPPAEGGKFTRAHPGIALRRHD